MPLYDYTCDRCGPFRAFRPMAEASRTQACPRCSVAAPRVLVAPYLSGGASSGWLTQPRAGGRAGSWRAACGFGCTHANCGR